MEVLVSGDDLRGTYSVPVFLTMRPGFPSMSGDSGEDGIVVSAQRIILLGWKQRRLAAQRSFKG